MTGERDASFGPRLHALRRGRLLSRHELGELVGSDQRVVERWERGAAYPRPAKQRRLCEALGVTAGQLLGERDGTPHAG